MSSETGPSARRPSHFTFSPRPPKPRVPEREGAASRARAAPGEGAGAGGFPLSLPEAAFPGLFEHHWFLRFARRMLGRPGAQQGEVVASERSEREKEAARGRLRRSRRGGGGRSRRGGGGGWRRGREERVGAAPVALGAALCGLPATRRALIRRPEPPHPGRPLPPRRPRHAGPERAPPAPAGMAGMAGAGAAGAGGRRGVGRSGTIPRAAGPRRGRGL